MEPGGIEPHPIPIPRFPDTDSEGVRATGRATKADPLFNHLAALWPSLAPCDQSSLVQLASSLAAAERRVTPDPEPSPSCNPDERSTGRKALKSSAGGVAGRRTSDGAARGGVGDRGASRGPGVRATDREGGQ
ncbi:MAG: hypothetical protein DHS20C14_01600 [Phycisphaeraceae bacterium]|nr:MAG: hypothetical protein DHS20C14_01600 [Phycisphaeraceae bacterium]